MLRSRLLRHFVSYFAFAGMLAACDAPVSECPDFLRNATQLIVVLTKSMEDVEARLAKFERPRPGVAWKIVNPQVPAVVGAAGLGWGGPFGAIAGENEAIKFEGDKRTPAGLYRVGASFGFAAEDWGPISSSRRTGTSASMIGVRLLRSDCLA